MDTQQQALPIKHKPQSAVQPLLYTKRDAAKLLSLSLRTIDNLIWRKELKAKRIGRRVLIPAAELRRIATPDNTRIAA